MKRFDLRSLLLPVILVSMTGLGNAGSPGDRMTAGDDGGAAGMLVTDTHEAQQPTNLKVRLRRTFIVESEIEWLAFSPNGRVLAAAGETLKLIDAKTGRTTATLMGTNGNVRTFVFSPDGKFIAASTSANEVEVWDVETGQLKGTLTGHKSSISRMEFNPDGGRLLTTSSDKTAGLWDVETGKLRVTIGEHKGRLLKGAFIKASFSPDARTFITTSSDDKTPVLWDAETGELKAVLKGHAGNVYAHSFSPDGQSVATAGFDNTVRIWDVPSGRLRASLGGCYAYDFEFSPDGRLLASACSNGEARLWDARESTLIRTLRMTSKRATTVDFSPDSQTLAACHPDINECGLWDVSAGRLLAKVAAEDGYKIKFSPDSRLLVTMDDRKRIGIRNARSGDLLYTLNGARWPVAFDTNGRALASIGQSNTILLSDLQLH